RIRMITDGVNLVADHRIETRNIKMVLEEIQRPEEIDILIDGLPVTDLEYFCTDPRPQRFEVNCRLPEAIAPGTRHLELLVGHRKLPPVPIEVTA
ncbi:MAG TPA: hypothetical protein VMB85_02195, partial [Bryobacteraceae bacterium]|nr:hypothetical protein [Bryobacteraceae bacterium]